jgi:hypothetical protein
MDFLRKLITPEWLAIVISYVGLVISFAALGVGFYQLKDLKRTRKHSESPFFEFNRLLTLGTLTVGGPAVFNNTDKILDNHPDGTVMIGAHNYGGESRLTEVVPLSGLEIQIWMDQKLIKNEEELSLLYPYSQSRRGRKERFRLRYETVSGEKGDQTFEFTHGFLDVHRIKIR